MLILLIGPYHIKIRNDLAPTMHLKPNTFFYNNKELLAKPTHVVNHFYIYYRLMWPYISSCLCDVTYSPLITKNVSRFKTKNDP